MTAELGGSGPGCAGRGERQRVAVAIMPERCCERATGPTGSLLEPGRTNPFPRPGRIAGTILCAVAATLPDSAAAQDLAGLAAQAAGGASQNAVILVVGLTLLSLAPGFAIMVTCFPFVVTVLSIMRQAIGLQQSPPNMLIVSLAIFLSWYVMDPVLRDAWQVAGAPLQRGEITLPVAFERGVEPFRRFMA